MDLYQIFITHNRKWSSLETVCYIIVFIIVIFVAAYLLYKQKIACSQVVAGFAAFTFLAIVFASTVFTRTPFTNRQYNLKLFWSWREVLDSHNWELLEENLLNCVLLFPLGVLLPLVFRRRIKWFKGFLYGFLVSAVIELCQLALRRGLFEWDDMIHNGLGCMLGCGLMSLINWLRHRVKPGGESD